MGQALSGALKSPVIVPFVGFSSIPKSLFLRIFLHSHTPFTLLNLLAKLSACAWVPSSHRLASMPDRKQK